MFGEKVRECLRDDLDIAVGGDDGGGGEGQGEESSAGVHVGGWWKDSENVGKDCR